MAEIAETVKMSYKTLFTVTFLHSRYGFPRREIISDNISLEPDAETQKIFINHSMGYRFFNDLLVVFMRCSNLIPSTPFIILADEVRLRFCINVSEVFLKKTEVEQAGATLVYQFSNKVNIGTDRFLSMHAEGVIDDDLESVDVAKADKRCFGVLDVYKTGANNTYNLFSSAEDTLKSPGYSIRFISKNLT